jgi:hypothetical protein
MENNNHVGLPTQKKTIKRNIEPVANSDKELIK